MQELLQACTVKRKRVMTYLEAFVDPSSIRQFFHPVFRLGIMRVLLGSLMGPSNEGIRRGSDNPVEHSGVLGRCRINPDHVKYVTRQGFDEFLDAIMRQRRPHHKHDDALMVFNDVPQLLSRRCLLISGVAPQIDVWKDLLGCPRA